MLEILFYGRAGQRLARVCDMLGTAALLDGKYAQTYMSFGNPRPGMPLFGVTRIDKDYIRERGTNFNKPDAVVVLDNSVIDRTDVTKGLKDNGMVIAYDGILVDRLKAKLGEGRVRTFSFEEGLSVDAREVAALAALVSNFPVVSYPALVKMVDQLVPEKERPACHRVLEASGV